MSAPPENYFKNLLMYERDSPTVLPGIGLVSKQGGTENMRITSGWVGYLIARNALGMAATIVILFASRGQALTVTSGPTFSVATNAPLAGVLALTTDTASQVSVTVSDGTVTWERDFFDYSTNHSETVLGFNANRTNEITVTVRDQYRNTVTLSNPVSFVTGPLPTNMPTFTLVTNNPSQMEPGYTLFRVSNQTTGDAYVTIVDSSGAVVWYGVSSKLGGVKGPISTPSDIQQLANGNLFYPQTDKGGFGEVNMLGQLVAAWTAPYPVDEHEDLMTDHGTILYLNYFLQEVAGFPTSATNPNAPTATTDVTCCMAVEISATNSTLLNSWSLIDMLQPDRIDYLCFQIPQLFGVDPEHANAIIDDTSDGSLIVSLRNQDAIVKFSRAGQIQWILGPHDNWDSELQPYLLTPVGEPFNWNYAQHAPIFTPQGTLLFYDDGNCRAEPFAPPVADQANYSRAAEFSIDETNMQVSQVWEYSETNDDRLFTSAVGNATWLPQTSNVLVTFGYVSYENGAHPDPVATNATVVRLKEVTHQANPSVVFDLEMSNPGNTNTNSTGYMVYRSHRIPDLYSHLALPVANLTVQLQPGEADVQFTADPARTYLVQASADLVNWGDLGAPSPDDADGDFTYQDEYDETLPSQYYRVITQ